LYNFFAILTEGIQSGWNHINPFQILRAQHLAEKHHHKKPVIFSYACDSIIKLTTQKICCIPARKQHIACWFATQSVCRSFSRTCSMENLHYCFLVQAFWTSLVCL